MFCPVVIALVVAEKPPPAIEKLADIPPDTFIFIEPVIVGDNVFDVLTEFLATFVEELKFADDQAAAVFDPE